MQGVQFVTGEIYHVYNRGVEKRTVFLNEKDYLRFIRSMDKFNDTAPSSNLHRPPLRLKFDSKQKELLVEFICFCLMPNHYHILLRQKRKEGVTEFMRKIGTGYTNYFNLRHNRVGPLFQGKFKAVHVKKESHLLYLPHYIHLNPLDITAPSWRERKISHPQKVLKYLESYRWSSYLDHIGIKNFPSILSQNTFQEFYGTQKEYRQSLREWIQNMDMNELVKATIEDPHEI